MGKIIKIDINKAKENHEEINFVEQIFFDCLEGFIEEDPSVYDKYTKEEIVDVLMSFIVLSKEE